MSKPSSQKQVNSEPSGASNRHACPACGSQKVARSQLEKYDALSVTFLRKEPYRCLQCYQRTWFKKTAPKGRKMSMLLVLISLSVMAFSIYKFFVEQPEAPSVSIVTPTTTAEPETTGVETDVANVEESSPSLASLINMPDHKVSDQSNTGLQASSGEYDQRQVDELSSDQQAALLLQAKQQAEAAEQLSQARVEQLEQVLLPVGDELESLIKVEVGYVVERWREAWATGNVDDYLITYGANFIPANNLELARWKQQRRARVTPEKQIELSLSEFDINMDEELNESTIDFNQRYQSGGYVENSRKRLTLQKEDGTWKIVRELELE